MKRVEPFLTERILLLLLLVIGIALAGVLPTNANEETPKEAVKEEYGLEDFFHLALERAYRIKIAEEDVAIAQAGKGKATAALLPRLSAFSSYTHYSEEKYINNGLMLIQPQSYQTAGLRMDYTLSLGGKEIIAYQMASAQTEKKKTDLRDAQEYYLLIVGTSFYDTLRAKKALDIAMANSQRLQAYVKAAQHRLDVGEVTRTVLLRAQSEYYGAEAQLVKTESSLANTKNALARLVNIGSDFNIREKIEPNAFNFEKLEYYQNLAFENREDLKALKINAEIAERLVRSTRSAHLPYLSLSGVYQKNDQSPLSQTFNKESAYITASINFPIFEGTLRLRETEEAIAKARQAKLAYEDLNASIATEVESVYNELMAILGSLKQQQAQTKYATSNFEAVNRQFEYGLASSLDVIDANTLLVSAQRELLDAEYSFQAAVLKMKRATGTLLQEIKNGLPTQ